MTLLKNFKIDINLFNIHFLKIFRIPTTIFGLPWHELKSLHKEEITSSVGENKKKHRKKLLGKLSKDLDYLETLTKLSPIGDDSQELCRIADDIVKKEAEEAINFLKERQEFWSQFKPMYCK